MLGWLNILALVWNWFNLELARIKGAEAGSPSLSRPRAERTQASRSLEQGSGSRSWGQFTHNAPGGAPVVIDLIRGIEGKANGLNPEIFRAVPLVHDGFRPVMTITRLEAFLRRILALLLLAGASCTATDAGALPQAGSRYQLVQPMYLMAVYDSLNNKVVSQETARAFLHARRYYQKSFVAFQVEVPVGTVMTIVGRLPRTWHVPFLVNRYLVRLDPDPSRGLDVELALDREGALDGLNPDMFRPLQ